MNRITTWGLLVLMASTFGVGSTTAQTPKADKRDDTSSKYLQFVKDGDQPVALRAAIVRFVPRSGDPPGMFVDLVSAIHVADRQYYTDLNRRFRDYDAVLYELVAPEGTRVPLGGVPRDSLVSKLQGGMKSVLGLTFQLDEVDYTKENLIHADMSPEEFASSMKDRGESMFGMMAKMMLQGMAQQAKDPAGTNDLKLLAALFSANRKHDLKVFMAEQFTDMDQLMGVFGGEDGSTLVTERNKKALDVLRREISAGHRRIAIFYGAGHMNDMEERLVADFGLKRSKETWVDAWDLRTNSE